MHKKRSAVLRPAFVITGHAVAAATVLAATGCWDTDSCDGDVPCNPPPVSCPQDAPTPGSACSAGAGTCTYASGCAVCAQGEWTVEEDRCSVRCPVLPPPVGAPCEVPDQVCTFERPTCLASFTCDGREFRETTECIAQDAGADATANTDGGADGGSDAAPDAGP